jgi:two-component system LytT family response regulator
VVLKTLNIIHVIEIDRIIRLESDRNYTIFYLVEKEKILMSRSMREYEETLLEHNFFRVHNSHLVNLNFVRKFFKDDLICVLSDNTNIPVAYRKRDELLLALQAL